jgi:hypothetical protein
VGLRRTRVGWRRHVTGGRGATAVVSRGRTEVRIPGVGLTIEGLADDEVSVLPRNLTRSAQAESGEEGEVGDLDKASASLNTD